MRDDLVPHSLQRLFLSKDTFVGVGLSTARADPKLKVAVFFEVVLLTCRYSQQAVKVLTLENDQLVRQ
jgi:hypothetical protein